MNSPNGERSYPTSDKIFPLGPGHRVAFMVSGNAHQLWVPLELLIGEWRSRRPPVCHDTVDAYLQEWLGFLAARTDLFTPDRQARFLDWMVRDVFLAVDRQILRQLDEAGLAGAAPASLDAGELAEQVISTWRDGLLAREDLAGFDRERAAAILDRHPDLVDDAIGWAFDDVPRTAGGDAALAEIAQLLVCKPEDFHTDSTVAVVGYGESQLFPALSRTVLRGVLDGAVRSTPEEPGQVSPEMTSSVHTFGQSDAVHSFLRGAHFSHVELAHQRIDAVLGAVRQRVGPELPDELDIDAAMGELSSAQHEELERDINDLEWSQFLSPMLDVVAALPRTDLAQLAESLVGLSVLRQTTNGGTETVGGPLDVATISRADGFSWTKNKHPTR